MTNLLNREKWRSRVKRILLGFAALVLLFLAALYLLANPILNSPFVTGKISGLLSSNLKSHATVKGIRLTGGTVEIYGLAISNPPGFAAGNLLSIHSVEVAPELGKLMEGRKGISTVRVRELRLSLESNARGEWNFTPMTRLFKGKKGGGEITVGRLIIEKSEITVNGRGMEDISVALRDISTKGSTDSSILLTCRDEYGDSFRLEGNGRLGDRPEFDIKLSGTDLTLKALKGKGLPVDPEKGRGRLLLAAALHGNEMKIRGDAAVDRLTLKTEGGESPLNIVLVFAGRYDLKKDEATLDSSLLQLDKAVRLNLVGKMAGLRKERLFFFTLSHDGVDAADLMPLIPGNISRGLQPAGTILPSTFHIDGSGREGIASIKGGVSLRQVGLIRGKNLLLDMVRADANLAGGKGGYLLTGRVSQDNTLKRPLLRLQDLPFSVKLSNGFHPMEGGIPAFAADFAGIPVKGSLLYRESNAEPVYARMELVESSVVRLARSFSVKDLDMDRGKIRGSLSARGNPTGELRCDLAASLAGVRGKYAGRKLALESGSATASANKKGADITATGKVKAGGGEISGKKFSLTIPWRLAGGFVTLNEVVAAMDRTAVSLGDMSIKIPRSETARGVKDIPLDLRFSKLRVIMDGSGADGVSGELHGVFSSMEGKRRLAGNGSLRAAKLLYKKTEAGSLTARLNLAGAGSAVNLSGNLLDGNLIATAEGDPFAPKNGVKFSLNLKDLAAARLSELTGNIYPVKAVRGILSISATGNFKSASDLLGRFSISGTELAFAARNNKTIMNGGKIGIAGEWDGGDLLIRDGTAALGKETELSFHGKLARAAAADREGEFALVMPKVPVVALLDNFANVLPRPLQEASADGSAALDARMTVKGKRAGMTGKLTMEEGAIDIPSQKLSLAAITGTIPFALEFGGKGSHPPVKNGLTRDNYAKLLSLMEKRSKGDHNFTIGMIRFGTTEFANTKLFITAGNGMTEIKSMGSALFGGALLGQGFFTVDGGVRYGADFLVHDLSLRELCNSYPAIKGYMSGRLDGFTSLYGQGTGLDTLKGFVEYWSRSSRDEKMLVSKEFLQKLAGKKLKGLFFQNDRPYDRGEITAYLEDGYLTFQTLDISHTNFLGMRDLSVSVAPIQNKISLGHLLASIREAATRGKAATGAGGAEQAPPETEFKWEQ